MASATSFGGPTLPPTGQVVPDTRALSNQLNARVEVFRKTAEQELAQSRKTLAGWLADKIILRPGTGVVAVISCSLHHLFSSYSASFRLESHKRYLMTEWVKFDHRASDSLQFANFATNNELSRPRECPPPDSFAWGKKLSHSLEEIQIIKGRLEDRQKEDARTF